MSKTKDYNWDKITQRHTEDESLDWLPNDETMSEAEVLGLQIQVLRDEISSFRDVLRYQYDRMRYYDETVTQEDILRWADRIDKIVRDLM